MGKGRFLKLAGEDMDSELMDMAMTWPRKGSREQLTQRPPTEVRQRHYGTSKASSHPPGYMGFIPSPAAGMRAIEHGQGTVPRPTQRCKEDTLFDSYREKPVGYLVRCSSFPSSVPVQRRFGCVVVQRYAPT